MSALVATVALLIVAYVHVSMPRFTGAGRKRLVAHAMLLMVGIVFGVVSAMLAGASAPPWAVFVTGLGVVHVPALCVLVIKRLRRSGRS
ncbi:hypothetical protein [Paraburkholderia dinghuensis]|uniref:Uncharacterized protein n=1 Tax=Paraburkholderia dinghuensis TaxID=2305225 RepID=A0A3N6N3J7_9BURK|nr:hypothetical protein [Paraburkholderia dinghuensis]RQH02217.1 hypothetical protein D1Y85_22315 [Paraburkholderia dinghuensis]